MKINKELGQCCGGNQGKVEGTGCLLQQPPPCLECTPLRAASYTHF